MISVLSVDVGMMLSQAGV